MKNYTGIILTVPNYSKIQIGSIVEIDTVYYTIIDINPRFNKKEDEEDNPAKYFVRNKINNKLMNFSDDEIQHISLVVYDYDKLQENKKILLGLISNTDLLELKYKIMLEHDLSDINEINPDDLINTIYKGEIISKEIKSVDESIPNQKINYFKMIKIE